MNDHAFVDTGIFVYARDADAGARQEKAAALIARLWSSRTGRTSMQVLNEYVVAVTQKLKPGMKPEAAWADVALLHAWNPLPVDWPLMESGWQIQQRYDLSWWNAQIVAAAQAMECRVIYTEEMYHGATYGGVKIMNPFLAEPAEAS